MVKQIIQFKLMNGPATAYLSPSGAYLALLGRANYVTILNTNTADEFTIQLANRNKNFTRLSNFHWVDDDNFKFNEDEYDRLQKATHAFHEKTLNIKTKRIIITNKN